MISRRTAGRGLAVIATTVVVGTAASVWWIQSTDSPVRTPSARAPSSATNYDPPEEFGIAPDIGPVDGGLAADEAVRQATLQIAGLHLRKRLKFPHAAEFPENSIRCEPYWIMNASTGDFAAHWFVDGAIEAPNDYGVSCQLRYRLMLGRTNHQFFPVLVTLAGLPVYQISGHRELLLAARQAEWQRKSELDSARKAEDLAAQRVLWDSQAASKSVEQKAGEALKLAMLLLQAGRDEAARRRLREIVEKFPGTRAAADAQTLLDQ